MHNKKRLVALVAATVAVPVVHAMTDAEIEARMKKYEAQIQALQSEVKELKANGGVVYVEDIEKQAKQNAKQIGDIKSRMDADAEKLKMNGFMTASVSSADDVLGTDYRFDENPNFRGDAKVGLQFNYKIGENSSAVVQLVARGRSNEPWETNAEWAYLSHGLSENIQVRMGRLRIPLYLQSETLDVGYAYPWVRPPIELYQTNLTSYEGADLLYKFRTGAWQHTLQPFAGSSSQHDDVDEPYGRIGLGPGLGNATAELQIDFQDLYGVTLNSTWGDFTTKLTTMHLGLEGRVVALDNTLVALNLLGVPGVPNVAAGGTIQNVDDSLSYYAGGVSYDNGQWFGMSELARISVTDGTLLPDSVMGHVTGGYRIDRWTPYAMWAFSHSMGDATVDREMESMSLGLRRELTDKLSAKLEWNHYYDLGKDNSGSVGNGAGGFSANQGDDADVYTLSLDAVF